MQLLHRHSAHAARILDVLRLVQNHEAEIHVLHQVNIPANQGIGCNQYIHILGFLHVFNLGSTLGTGTGHHHHAQLRREPFQFAKPVVSQGRRRNHQRSLPLLPGGLQHGNDLHRFAQAHIVCQNAAHVQLVQGHQPMEATLLIGAQAQTGRKLNLLLIRVDQSFHRFLHRAVHFNGQGGGTEQAVQVTGAVGTQGHRILCRGYGIRPLHIGRFKHAVRKGLPLVHAGQVQERAILQPEIPAMLA